MNRQAVYWVIDPSGCGTAGTPATIDGLVIGEAKHVPAPVGAPLADARADRQLDPELHLPGPPDGGNLVLAVKQRDRRQPPEPGERVIGVLGPPHDEEFRRDGPAHHDRHRTLYTLHRSP